jgi:VWFA-related protein
MTRVFHLALLASVSILAVSVESQQPQTSPQPPVFRSGVELVQVEVVVTDRDGRPVRGLTQADFAVLDRKKPQQIAAFEEVRHDRPDAPLPFPADLKMDVSDNRYGPSERLVVVVIDDYNIWMYRTDKAKEIARRIIEQLSSRASMALLFTSRTGSTEVTQDRAELLAAVGRMKGRQQVPRPGAQCVGKGPCGTAMVARIAGQRTLEDAARFIRANDGRRKAFVFVSEMAPPGGAGVDLLGEDADDNSLFRFRLGQMLRSLHESNVAVYSLDPRGHVSNQELVAECFPAPAASGRDVSFDSCTGDNWGQRPEDGAVRVAQRGLEHLAEATGGFGIVNTDDFAGGIDRLVESLDNYYLLGFYPSDPRGGIFRPMRVTVNRPDVTVRYRRGYMPPKKVTPPKRPDPAGTLLAAPMPMTTLPVRVFAAALPTGKKEARVIVSTEITLPADRLRQADGRLADTLAHVLVAGDMNVGKSKKQVRRTITFDARPTNDAPAVFTIQSEVVLPPGRYQIRSAVHSQTLQQGGASYLPIDVPDFRKAATPLGNLVLMRAGSPVPGEAAPAGVPVPPTLDREFYRSDLVRIYTEVARSNNVDPASARLVITDANNTRVLSRPVRAIRIDDHRHALADDITLDLAAGAYRLTIVLESTDARREVASSSGRTANLLEPSGTLWNLWNLLFFRE